MWLEKEFSANEKESVSEKDVAYSTIANRRTSVAINSVGVVYEDTVQDIHTCFRREISLRGQNS